MLDSKTLTDVHVHMAALPADNGVIVSPRMLRSPVLRMVAWAMGLPIDQAVKANTMYWEQLRTELSRSKRVSKAVLLAMDGTYRADGRLDERATDFMIPNDLVFAKCAEDDRFLPGVSVNPSRRDAIEELERCAAKGAALVKVLPNAQSFDPAEPRYVEFYKTMARLRLPLLSHVGWEFTLIGKDQSAGDPSRLLAPLEAGVTVIAAHGCSQGLIYTEPHVQTMLDLAKRYPEFYVDLSALTLPNRARMLLILRDHPELRDRLLFATDFPLPCFAYPALMGGISRYREARKQDNRFDRQAAVLDALDLTPRTDFSQLVRRP